MLRRVLEQLEDAEDPVPGLAFLAAQTLVIDPGELRSALRRALLLLAAGGDPRRELEFDGRAVRAVADDLDAPEPRAALVGALLELRREATGLPRVAAALDALLADADAAWRWTACVLLADELGGAD